MNKAKAVRYLGSIGILEQIKSKYYGINPGTRKCLKWLFITGLVIWGVFLVLGYIFDLIIHCIAFVIENFGILLLMGIILTIFLAVFL
jgi:hypothetical protein